jgi:hypothetical protein
MGQIAQHGAPRFVRADNGPEFIAKHLMRMSAVKAIRVGSPVASKRVGKVPVHIP